MKRSINNRLNRVAGLGKRLLLIDGAGALLSVLMLGGVLANYPEAVGLPRNVLLFLAGLAVIFAGYSFSCYRWAGSRWRSFLRVIAVGNLMYCGLTLGTVLLNYKTITAFGTGYFVVEVLVVSALAYVERRAAKGGEEAAGINNK